MAKPKPIQYPPIPPNTAPHVFVGILLGAALSMVILVSHLATKPAEATTCAETEAKIP